MCSSESRSFTVTAFIPHSLQGSFSTEQASVHDAPLLERIQVPVFAPGAGVGHAGVGAGVGQGLVVVVVLEVVKVVVACITQTSPP